MEDVPKTYRRAGDLVLLQSNALTYSGNATTATIKTPKDEAIVIVGAVASGTGLANHAISSISLDRNTNYDLVISHVAGQTAKLPALDFFTNADAARSVAHWHGNQADLELVVRAYCESGSQRSGLREKETAPDEMARRILVAIQNRIGHLDVGCFVVGGKNTGDVTISLTDLAGNDSLHNVTLIGYSLGKGAYPERAITQHNTPYWVVTELAGGTTAGRIEKKDDLQFNGDGLDAFVGVALSGAHHVTSSGAPNLEDLAKWRIRPSRDMPVADYSERLSPSLLALMGGAANQQAPRSFQWVIQPDDYVGFIGEYLAQSAAGTLTLALHCIGFDNKVRQAI